MDLGEVAADFEFLAIANFALLKIGIDIKSLNGRELLRYKWKFLFFIGCNVYMKWAMIDFISQNLEQIGAATRPLSLMNQGFLILIKVLIFLFKGDKCIKLIRDMNQLAKNANSLEHQKWLEENRLALAISKSYFYLCWVSVTMAGMIPICFMLYQYIRYQNFSPAFPIDGIFPLDGDGLSFLIFNYICCFLYVYSLLNMTVGIDSLYGWFILNISAHFRILRCKIEKAASKLDQGDDSFFTQDLNLIVRYHIQTLKFVDRLNEVFGGILWFEVTMSCLQMAFVLYNLQNESDASKLPFCYMTMLTVCMQLMMYCFGGQKIKNESLYLNSDIYLCFPWHKMTPSQKKLVLMPLMRSQHLSVLRGLFFEADNCLLVYILKTAFSFNTLLSAINE